MIRHEAVVVQLSGITCLRLLQMPQEAANVPFVGEDNLTVVSPRHEMVATVINQLSMGTRHEWSEAILFGTPPPYVSWW